MTDQFGISCAPLLMQFYIKYPRLVDMTNTVFCKSNADECNIFIDLHSMIKSLYSKVYNPILDQSPNDIAAIIINIIAHYRRFFWDGYQVKTNFYLIYSTCSAHSTTIYYPNYNKSFIMTASVNKAVHNSINDNIQLVNEIVSYINNACLVCTTFDTATMIKYIQDKNNDGLPNIIITKDEHTMQLLNENNVIYRPKKMQGNDMSYYITGADNGPYIHLCTSRNNQVSDSIANSDTPISPELYSFVLAMSGCKDRDMKSIISTSASINMLHSSIKKGFILNGYHSDIVPIIESFDAKNLSKLHKAGVVQRFKALDANIQSMILLNHTERLNYTGFHNLYDPQALHKIATEYFMQIPLDLEHL